MGVRAAATITGWREVSVIIEHAPKERRTAALRQPCVEKATASRNERELRRAYRRRCLALVRAAFFAAAERADAPLVRAALRAAADRSARGRRRAAARACLDKARRDAAE
jgi:hypothetical protein